MPDYKAMYIRLAGKVADAIELLTLAQLEGERAVMDGDKPALSLVQEDGEEKD